MLTEKRYLALRVIYDQPGRLINTRLVKRLGATQRFAELAGFPYRDQLEKGYVSTLLNQLKHAGLITLDSEGTGMKIRLIELTARGIEEVESNPHFLEEVERYLELVENQRLRARVQELEKEVSQLRIRLEDRNGPT